MVMFVSIDTSSAAVLTRADDSPTDVRGELNIVVRGDDKRARAA